MVTRARGRLESSLWTWEWSGQVCSLPKYYWWKIVGKRENQDVLQRQFCILQSHTEAGCAAKVSGNVKREEFWKYFPVLIPFIALSSLYRSILACSAKNLGSLNREFAISKVRCIERIYESLIRPNPRERDFSS